MQEPFEEDRGTEEETAEQRARSAQTRKGAQPFDRREEAHGHGLTLESATPAITKAPFCEVLSLLTYLLYRNFKHLSII